MDTNMIVWLRAACKHCAFPVGFTDERGGQLCVFCAYCRRYAGYNLPRREVPAALVRR